MILDLLRALIQACPVRGVWLMVCERNWNPGREKLLFERRQERRDSFKRRVPQLALIFGSIRFMRWHQESRRVHDQQNVLERFRNCFELHAIRQP